MRLHELDPPPLRLNSRWMAALGVCFTIPLWFFSFRILSQGGLAVCVADSSRFALGRCLNLLLVVLPFSALVGPLVLYYVTLDLRVSGVEFSASRYWGLMKLRANAKDVVVLSGLAIGGRGGSIYFEVRGRRYIVDGKFSMYSDLAKILDANGRSSPSNS
jgi:hypothetical protein